MFSNSGAFGWFFEGGVVMYPLLLCSLIIWGVIFERWWAFRKVGQKIQAFHSEALRYLLQKDEEALKSHCQKSSEIPTAQLVLHALEKRNSKDIRVQKKWSESLERKRQEVNLSLKGHLWLLGTIANAAPFIGLFGTVVGILQSFRKIAETGAGGFAVVAGGISEALVATAAGIIVAVIASIAFNTFQNRWAKLVLIIKHHTQEMADLWDGKDGAL